MFMKIPSAIKSQTTARLLLDPEKLQEFNKEVEIAQDIYSKSLQKAYAMTNNFQDFCKAANFVAERYEQALQEFLKLYTNESKAS
jgi:hypothetical protein